MAEFMHSIGGYAYLLLFLLTAAEASAFIGLFIPGETALLLSGYLASRGQLNLTAAIAAALLGAILGDSLGYEIGRRLGPRLRTGRLGALVGEQRWNRANRAVTRHGPNAVLIGRFVGVLRAVVPAVVGDARMPYRRFLFWNALGAIVWTPSIILAGYYAGSACDTVASVLSKVAVAVPVAVAALAIVTWITWSRRHRQSNPSSHQ